MMKPYKTYYEMLKTDRNELDVIERDRFEKARAIPPSVRRVAEARVTELTNQILELEKETDELKDFLDGYTYNPATGRMIGDKEVPF